MRITQNVSLRLTLGRKEAREACDANGSAAPDSMLMKELRPQASLRQHQAREDRSVAPAGLAERDWAALTRNEEA